MNRVAAEVRYLRAVAARWTYAIRPYDYVADARRWRWQRATPCGRAVFAHLPADTRTALETAAARHLEARTVNLELAAAREQALTIRCPYLPCLAAVGDPCVNRDGRELGSQPAHLDRMRDAGVTFTPTTVDELADQPQRTWSPTDAIRRDQR